MNDQKQRKPGKIISDPEVQAIARVGELLDGLTADQRQRVLIWLQARYLGGQPRVLGYSEVPKAPEGA